MWHRNCSPPQRRGYLLAECLVVLLLLSLALSAAMPRFWDWQEEQELDRAAAELAYAIRQTEILAKNGGARNESSIVKFTLSLDEKGRVIYFASRSSRRIQPKGTFSDRIVMTTPLDISFQRTGFAGSGKDAEYSTQLSTRNKKHMVRVVTAAYTGRVRVEKIR